MLYITLSSALVVPRALTLEVQDDMAYLIALLCLIGDPIDLGMFAYCRNQRICHFGLIKGADPMTQNVQDN